MDDGALIGEEQDTGRVFVEATHAGNDGVSFEPTRWEQVVDGLPFALFVGADTTWGFVIKREEPIGGFDGLAVDGDLRGGDFDVGGFGDIAVDTNAAGFEPEAGFAPAAIAARGEELVQSAQFHELHHTSEPCVRQSHSGRGGRNSF